MAEHESGQIKCCLGGMASADDTPMVMTSPEHHRITVLPVQHLAWRVVMQGKQAELQLASWMFAGWVEVSVRNIGHLNFQGQRCESSVCQPRERVRAQGSSLQAC